MPFGCFERFVWRFVLHSQAANDKLKRLFLCTCRIGLSEAGARVMSAGTLNIGSSSVETATRFLCYPLPSNFLAFHIYAEGKAD